jgi:thymidylate synthase
MIEEAEWKTNFLIAEGDSPNDMYVDILSQLLEKGKDVSPRGLQTLEVRPAMITFLKPYRRIITCPGRHAHPYFQILEAIWILGGRGDVEFISYYLKNMRKYSDGKGEFHAPYGIRLRKAGMHRSADKFTYARDQFADCYELLRKEPDTRQAIITFWNPAYDNPLWKTADKPCNIAMQFLIRNGKLHFTIFNRSNDVNYGLFNTNVVQFSVLLETMAMLLDIPVGFQTHLSNSLHLYDAQDEITSRVLNAEYQFNAYDHVNSHPFAMKDSSLGFNKFSQLVVELDMFFVEEERIREGDTTFPDGEQNSFTLLNDGLTLARSFYAYKHENYSEALSSLSSLNDDAIYISCCEFLERNAKFRLPLASDNFRNDIADAVQKRMGARITKESFLEIMNYIIRH